MDRLRPSTKLLSLPIRTLPTSTPSLTQYRAHQISSRTRRALRVPPHASFVAQQTPSPDEILFNQPSAPTSVYYTPFRFLPSNDPRRRNNLASLFGPDGSRASTPSASEPSEPLAPVLHEQPAKRYHLTAEDVAEIRRLRAEDPATWTIKRLASTFDCSETFITICGGAPREYKDRLSQRMDRVQDRWGPRKRTAKLDKFRRKEMLLRGEI